MAEQDATERSLPTPPSFDPKTWLDSSATPDPSPSAVPTPREPRDGEPRDGEPRDGEPRTHAAGRRVLAASLVGIGVLISLAIMAFYLARQRPAAPRLSAPASVSGAVRVLTAESVERVGPALAASGLDPTTVAAVDKAMATAPFARAEQLRLHLTTREDGGAARLQALDVRDTAGAGLRLTANGAGFTVTRLNAVRTLRVSVVRGEIDQDTFYASAVAAGVPDLLITPFAQAFAFDFDFQREIKDGQFEAAYEDEVGAAGERQGRPRLIYVALNARVRSRAFYRFKPPSGAEESWFDASGNGTVRGLMRTPVEGARVTSTFGPRMHPVLGFRRDHKGVDFGVPVGATVFASGAGVVTFVGPHGGHGNYVEIRHSEHLSTAYAHLSAFDVVKGASILQSQPVGRSGNTGLSNGPHLHYEVIVDGQQVDPLTFTTAQAQRLAAGDLAAFLKEKERIDRVRAAAL